MTSQTGRMDANKEIMIRSALGMKIYFSVYIVSAGLDMLAEK